MVNWGLSVGGFSAGSGDSGATNAGGTGTLLGTNTLQTSIDKFATAVDKLDTLIAKVGGMAGGSTSMNGGGPSVSSTAHNLSGWMQPPAGASQLPITTPTGSYRTPNGGGAAARPFQSQTQAGNGGSTGGGGFGGGPISSIHSALGSPGGQAAAGGAMLADSMFMYGKSQLPTQVAMSSYVQTSSLMMNGGNPTINGNSIRYAAFGGGGQNLNGLALNAQDAIQGQQGINFVAGQGAVGPNTRSSYGRGALSGAAAFGLSNQGMSYAQSSQLMQQMYSPSMSTKFLQYGFPVTPRMMGGGLRNPTQVAQGMIQGFYGKNKVNPTELAFSLRQGGNAQLTLQAMMGNQSGDYSNMLMAENQVAWNSGMNQNQINSLFNSAARGSTGSMKAAQAKLQGFGVSTSDIQSIKNLNSIKTGRSSDVANSFNSGLQTSVGLLSAFNNILTKIIDIPGINQLVGGAGGFSGGLGSLASGGAMGVGAAGASMLLKSAIASRAGSAAGTAASGTAADSAALEAGGAGAGMGLSVAGTAGAAALLYGLHSIHNKNGTNWLQQGPGGPHAGENSWSGLGKNLLNWGWNDPQNFFHSLLGGGGGNNQPNRPGGAKAPTGSKSVKAKNSPSVGGVSGAAKHAVGSAEQEIGVPYVWGGDSPKVGFDCSGLVEWAYGTAGVRLPRTSQEQWAALSRQHSVPTDKVIEGDLVFMAGSDGTDAAPGHVGMMINSRQLIQAPYTGADVQVIPYDPRAWQHAARPSGSISGSSPGPASSGPGTTSGLDNNNSGSGNSGIGMNSGTYGSSEEIDNLTSALLGGAGGGVATGFATPSNGSSGSKSTSNPVSGGSATPGLMSVARFVMKHGASIAAAAGIAGTVAGESGGNPESVGSGGAGIISWTPPSSAAPIKNIITGNADRDMGNQLVDMLHYIAGRGGMGAINSAGKKGPMGAASEFSHMLAPLVPGSDIRSGAVKDIYHQLGGKGYASGTSNAMPGWAWTGERGPELKSFAGGEQVMRTSQAHLATQSAKGVTEPSALISAPNASGVSCNGHDVSVELTLAPGAITIQGGLGSSTAVTQSANEMVAQVVRKLKDQQVFADIAAGAHSGN